MRGLQHIGLTAYLKCLGINQGRSIVPNDPDCPQCGEIVEIWSDERQRTCKKCGTVLYNHNSLPKVQIMVSQDQS